MAISKLPLSLLLSVGLHAAAIAGLSWQGISPNYPTTETTTVVEVVLYEELGKNSDFAFTPPQKRPARSDEAVLPNEVLDAKRELKKVSEAQAEPEGLNSKSNAADSTHNLSAEGNSQASEPSTTHSYVVELRRILDRKKIYPLVARKLGQQGQVLIRFHLRRDGHLVKAEVVQASRYETLNRAAQDLINSIDGLAPFPSEIKKEYWSFVVPVEYQM